MRSRDLDLSAGELTREGRAGSTGELPRGTVTLLVTDVEGSTRLLQALGERYANALADHRALLRAAFHEHGGHEVDARGDSFFVAFAPGVALTLDRRLGGVDADANPHAQAVGPGVGVEGALTRHGRGDGVFRPLPSTTAPASASLPAAGRSSFRGQRASSSPTRRAGSPSATSASTGLRISASPSASTSLLWRGSNPNSRLRERLTATPPTSRPSRHRSVGRKRELAALCALLRRRDVRLLTLTGAGGAGKTRLAVQAWTELLEEIPDGVFFVTLAPLTDPALVLPTIAHASTSRNSPVGRRSRRSPSTCARRSSCFCSTTSSTSSRRPRSSPSSCVRRRS